MALQTWIIEGTSNSSEWKSRLVVELISQDIINNYSTLKITFQWTRARSSSYAWNGSNTSYGITLDGQTQWGTCNSYNYSSVGVNDWKSIGSMTLVTRHDTVGEKIANISGQWSQSGVQPTSCTASGSIRLPTIHRASSISCSGGNIGESTTINISRASSSFTHTLRYRFYSSYKDCQGTIVNKTSATSVGWTIPTDFYGVIPHKSSGWGEIFCDTYNGNTLIGTKTITVWFYVVKSEPTISAVLKDINPTTKALTGDENILVKYYSNVQAVVKTTPKNGASIARTTLYSGSRSVTSETVNPNIQMNNVDLNQFEVVTVDSRGFQATTGVVTKSMVQYVKLGITKIKRYRPETTSNTIKLTMEGNYFNSGFGAVNNTLVVKFMYREVGATTWSEAKTLIPTISGNTFVINDFILGIDFDYTKSYEIYIEASDKLITIVNNDIVPAGIPLISTRKRKVNINGDLKVWDENVVASGGNNSTGFWIKYYDGTMLVYHTIKYTNTITVQNGALCEATEKFPLGSFPIGFIGDNPKVIPHVVGANWALISRNFEVTTSSAGSVWLMRTGETAAQPYEVSYIAIGRWK